MKFVMYGAGSIGRGFIGAVFAKAGYEVVFIDINQDIVDALNNEHKYPVHIVDNPPYTEWIEGVRAVDGRDTEAVISEITQCDIMATSLGANVLERVAPVLAQGLYRRSKKGLPLNILICENLKNAAPKLSSWIENALPKDDKDLIGSLGLIEAAIGRMVPVAANPDGNILGVSVEPYEFLPVDAAGFIGDAPNVPQLIPFEPFAFYEDRKLYLHNMGHAVCAYLGLKLGYQYIWQAIGDLRIRSIVQNAMLESSIMLADIYDQPFSAIYDHAEDLLARFGNQGLGDTCERVGRDPLRKLASDDRLAAPLKNCLKHKVFPGNIAIGLAAALMFAASEETGWEDIAKDVCKLDGEALQIVSSLYGKLSSGADLEDCFALAMSMRRDYKGKII